MDYRDMDYIADRVSNNLNHQPSCLGMAIMGVLGLSLLAIVLYAVAPVVEAIIQGVCWVLLYGVIFGVPIAAIVGIVKLVRRIRG